MKKTKLINMLFGGIILALAAEARTALATVANSGDVATAATVTNPNQSEADAVLQAKIQTAYNLNPVLNRFHLKVDADQKVVTLSGAVQSQPQKDLAVAIAKSFPEVIRVNDDQLIVDKNTKAGEKTGDIAQKIADATITTAVKTKLLVNTNTSALNINVETINGVVKLSGTVHSNKEKVTAGKLAHETTGVSGVKNNIKVIR